MSWSFADAHGLDGGGRPAKWGYDDIRKLISEHLGLFKAEEPDLSIVGGVMWGDGKIREKVKALFDTLSLPVFMDTRSRRRAGVRGGAGQAGRGVERDA